MTDRERLIDLMIEAKRTNPETGSFTDYLADYLLEHGVTALPCKVGDTIYQTDGVRIYTSTIYEITYTENKVIFVTENVVFDARAINNSIFLTREEAEQALIKGV
jgi:hypothetical protein|nr:MAG TPA: hypothetical protein [Caudoviricetes sp.]